MKNTGNRNFTKVTIDNIVFDSTREGMRYKELKTLQQAGIIRNLAWHTKHQLELNDRPLLIRSERYPNGRKSSWTDDFSYEVRATVEVVAFDGVVDHRKAGWERVVEDVKGRDTYEERFKRGVFELLTGIQITVVH